MRMHPCVVCVSGARLASVPSEFRSVGLVFFGSDLNMYGLL
jgi:hypothetical protein